jgi:hypothetical protein
MKLTKLFTATGEPFSYYPGLVHEFNISVNATVFLCFIAWRTFPDELGGWKSLSIEIVEHSTGLSVKEQSTARKQLVQAGLIEERYARLEHKLKFRILPAEIAFSDEIEVSPNADSAYAQTPKGSMPKRLNGVSTKELKGNKKGTREGIGADAPSAVVVPVANPELPEEARVWNDHIGLRKIQSVSSGRAKALKARRSDPFFQFNWREAIKKVAASAFCNGENDRGWRADFDFFLRPDTVVKIMEGKYDRNQLAKKSGFGQTCY